MKPARPGGPPLYIAGQAEPSVRRAARIGDAWLIVNTSGLGKVQPLMQTYRAALKEYGRIPIVTNDRAFAAYAVEIVW